MLLEDEDVLDVLLDSIFVTPHRMEHRVKDGGGDPTLRLEEEADVAAGVIVDGFPRTAVQVGVGKPQDVCVCVCVCVCLSVSLVCLSDEGTPPMTPSSQVDFVKLLHEKLEAMHHESVEASPQGEAPVPRPIFRILVLYVSEDESVNRQLDRGKKAAFHKDILVDSGAVGEEHAEEDRSFQPRNTDMSERAARQRYSIFREHYHTLLRLRRYFHFTMINAMGSLEQCESQVRREKRAAPLV